MAQGSFSSNAVHYQSNQPLGFRGGLRLSPASVPRFTSSPVGDRVISLVAETGCKIQAVLLLLRLLLSSSELTVLSSIPHRAYDLIQQTRLRSVPFIYQCFGTYQDEIVKNALHFVLPNEIEMSFSIQEPAYKIEVQLGSLYVCAHNKLVPLQSGML
ncbi:hypothetical protein Rhein_2937 [Rheinheimera sp. A13L]|nr:hypothetical protein Rhein_2937 [Rheinheimera sp. A13L]